MAPIESTCCARSQLLLEHAVLGDVEREADHADDLAVPAERLEPNLGHAAS
jgi:hypothetical protein